MLIKNKQDLFVTWMESGRNWDHVTLSVQRSMEQRNRSRSGWIAKQGKVLKEEWKNDLPKLEGLLKARTDAGLCYDDPDFPGDEDVARLHCIRL